MNNSDISQALSDAEESINTSITSLPRPIRRLIEPIIRRNLKSLGGKLDVPKIALYGRAGSGKSSVVNALLGQMIAPTGSATSVTMKPTEYRFEKDGWKIDIVDTRGGGDSENGEAIQQAIDYIVERKVDVLLFVVPADERGWVANDVKFLRDLQEAHKKSHKSHLITILVINKIDRVPPISEWNPPYNTNLAQSSHPETNSSNARIAKENNMRQCIDARIKEYNTITHKYIPICAYWDSYESRFYNIDNLAMQVYDSLPDSVKPGFAGVITAMEVKKEVARALAVSCALAVGMTSLVPIPLLGAVSIIAIQVSLVSLIARIGRGNQDQNRVAKKFIENLGTYGIGVSFTFLIQQITNYIPIVGVPVTAAVAATLSAITLALGGAAIKHFIEGSSIEESQQLFVQLRKTSREQFLQAFRRRKPENVAEKLKDIIGD